MLYLAVFFFGIFLGTVVSELIDSYVSSRHTLKLYGIPFQDSKGNWRFSVAERLPTGLLNSVAVSSIEDRYTTPEEVKEMLECIKRMKIVETDIKV